MSGSEALPRHPPCIARRRSASMLSYAFEPAVGMLLFDLA